VLVLRICFLWSFWWVRVGSWGTCVVLYRCCCLFCGGGFVWCVAQCCCGAVWIYLGLWSQVIASLTCVSSFVSGCVGLFLGGLWLLILSAWVICFGGVVVSFFTLVFYYVWRFLLLFW